MQPNTGNIIEFLTEEFKKGLTYNWIVSTRSILSHYLPCDITNYSTVSTFLKGVCNLITPAPKYFAIWNVNILLSHMQHKETFYDTTKKLAALFMILAGARVNTLVHLKVANMYITDTEIIFTFDEVLKQSRWIYKQESLISRAFTPRDLFPVTTLITYLKHKLLVRSNLYTSNKIYIFQIFNHFLIGGYLK